MGETKYSIRRVSASITQSGSGTSASAAAIPLNGKLWQVNTKPGTLGGGGTAQLSLTDQDGATVWTGTATASGAIQADKNTAPIVLSGQYTLNVTFSASQTNQVVNATYLIENGF